MTNIESKEIQLLRKFKETTGLSFSKLGQTLGVNGHTIYNWFRGHQQPSDMAKKLIMQSLVIEKRGKHENFS